MLFKAQIAFLLLLTISSCASKHGKPIELKEKLTQISFEKTRIYPLFFSDPEKNNAEMFVIETENDFLIQSKKLGFTASTKDHVNFNSENLVLIYGGKRNTGGHSCELTHITLQKNNYFLKSKVTKPGIGCISTDVITFPISIYKFQKPIQSVKYFFDISEFQRNCN